MKEHQILFSTKMVRAILEGRKTTTRRIVKPQPIDHISEVPRTIQNENDWGKFLWEDNEGKSNIKHCPYGQIGDVLWVRETWADLRGMGFSIDDFPNLVAYKADSKEEGLEVAKEYGIKWKPPIFMPRSASRLSLRITNIRVERLNEITEEDSEREGAYCTFQLDSPYGTSRKTGFKILWESINGESSWEQNPWVWVIEFERIK